MVAEVEEVEVVAEVEVEEVEVEEVVEEVVAVAEVGARQPSRSAGRPGRERPRPRCKPS